MKMVLRDSLLNLAEWTAAPELQSAVEVPLVAPVPLPWAREEG